MGTWTLSFKALDGTSCSVQIVSPGPGTQTLIGTDEPFVMDEDSSTDLLECVRTQTGVLRLIEESYGDLDGLVPDSQVSHAVTFTYGGTVRFFGYIQPTNAESDWTACPRVREFAVASPLSILDYYKFIVPSSPTYVSLFDILDEIATQMGYSYIVYPSSAATDLAETVNSLSYCPFNPDFAANRDNADLYKPETYTYGIEGICRAMGWIAYDEPDRIVFVPIHYNSTVTFSQRSTSGTTTSITPSTININNNYTICSANGTESIVRGLKEINVKYDGEFPKQVGIPYERCKLYTIYDGQSGAFGPNRTEFSCAYLELQTDEVYSAYMDNFININNDELQSTGICMTCSGVGEAVVEQILMSFSNNWRGTGTFIQFKWYEHPTGNCRVDFHVKWTEPSTGGFDNKLSNLGNKERTTGEEFTFAIKAKCGGWYYTGRFTYPFWLAYESGSYPMQVYMTIDRKTGDGSIYLRNVPSEGPLELFVSLPVDTSKVNDCGIYNGETLAIDRVGVSVATEIFDQYTNNVSNEETIEGSMEATDTASVTWPFTFYRDNTHLIGNSIKSGSPSYDDLFETKTCVKADFRVNSLSNPHMNLYTLDGGYYRLIGYSINPSDSQFTLNLLSV